MAKLKVYRTAIGFHDAYVAAPSQKAALAAWGSDRNLFAHAAAELVTDAALTKEPLASPGKVIKRLRGTADEQLAALPPDKPRAPKPKTKSDPPARAAPKPPPRPRPSRAALDKAEAAIDALQRRQHEELADLEKREAALAAERKRLVGEQRDQADPLKQQRDRAADAYDRAIRAWQED